MYLCKCGKPHKTVEAKSFHEKWCPQKPISKKVLDRLLNDGYLNPNRKHKFVFVLDVRFSPATARRKRR